jgi:hypothetical protein
MLHCCSTGVSSSIETTRLGGGALELGDGLGALRHGVLGQLSGEEQADSGLDLAGREGALLVVAGQTAGLKGKALEDVVDERVQDGHAALADAGVGVHLLEDLVDVRAVALDSLLGLALASGLLGGLRSLLSNTRGLCHLCYSMNKI